MKLWVYVTFLLLILPISFAMRLCENPITVDELPCEIVSSWKYENCSSSQAYIFNTTPTLVSVRNFSDYAGATRCNFTWNISRLGRYFWNVTPNGDSGQMIVENREAEMASLALTLFFGTITFVLFYLGFKGGISDNELLEFVARRCLVLGGMFLLSLDTAMMATIASHHGLNLLQSVFRYLWLINWTIYVLMVALMWGTLMRGLKMMKWRKEQKRMGNG